MRSTATLLLHFKRIHFHYHAIGFYVKGKALSLPGINEIIHLLYALANFYLLNGGFKTTFIKHLNISEMRVQLIANQVISILINRITDVIQNSFQSPLRNLVRIFHAKRTGGSIA